MKKRNKRPGCRFGRADLILYLFFVSLFMFASCSGRESVKQQLPAIDPYTGPVSTDVLKRSAGFRNIRSIRASADVVIYRQGEAAGSLSGVFGYLSPESIKATFFGPFGVNVMEILFTKEIIQISLPAKNELYEMEPAGILFSGLDESRWLYSMQEDRDYYQLIAYDSKDSPADPAVSFIFDRTYLLNRKIIAYKGQEKFLSIDFSDFNGTLPGRIRLSFGNNFEIDVRLSETEYDADISPEYFLRQDGADKKVLPFTELIRHLDPKRLQ